MLDQSGSMAFDFDGNQTSTDSARRQYAMKQAVSNFIQAVAGKYDAAKSDHRISIVTFGSGAAHADRLDICDPDENVCRKVR